MAKKKATGAKTGAGTTGGGRMKNILILRGSAEWKAWLEEVADANGAPITTTVEQALRDYGEKLKVRKPPKRVP